MTSLVRFIIHAAMGMLAGLAAWPLLEVIVAFQALFGRYLLFSIAAGAVFGLVYGSFFGAVDGIIAGTRRRIVRGIAFGALYGLVGGALGFVLGQLVLLIVGEAFLRSAGRIATVGTPIARATGWAILGAVVGSAEGVRRRSWRKIGVGIGGGLLGGILGGLAIELIPAVLSPAWARPLGLVGFGLLVAGAYALVERRVAAGRLRLLNGIYKHKEFILNQRRLTIGSDERCDLFLGSYRRVDPLHALVSDQAGHSAIEPATEDSTLVINDEPVGPGEAGVRHVLKYGDVIAIGSARLVFRPLAAIVAAAAVTLTALALPAPVTAQSTTVSQVDSARLLTRQEVDLYVSVIGENGDPVGGLRPADFAVFEAALDTADSAAAADAFAQAEIVAVQSEANLDRGVTFYLLVDNSGSMYDTLAGTPTEEASETRMTAARAAIRAFLARVDNPRDRVALATFNTGFTVLSPPTDSIRTVDTLLDQIERPASEDAYTELYRGLALAAEEIAALPGRVAVIVLSDGENFPYSVHSGSPHPVYGDALVSVDEASARLTRLGISAYAINFATSGDAGLERIARENGGLVFGAGDESRLTSVYAEIRARILSEYRVTYRAGIAPADYRRVRVVVTPPSFARPVQAERDYYAGTLFGLPSGALDWRLLIPFLVALPAAAGLTLLRFRRVVAEPTIEVTQISGATRAMSLGSGRTVIGASPQADVTVAGEPDLRDRHATIVHDEATGSYTVVSEEPVLVNNKPTTKRRLEPGDLIEMPGATIVFDEPEKPGGR